MIRPPICVEETRQTRGLKQMTRAITHPSQLQVRVTLVRDPECLDQRSDPGAVDITQLRQVDDELYQIGRAHV